MFDNFSRMNNYLTTSTIGQIGQEEYNKKAQIKISVKSKRHYTDSVRCPIGVIDYLQKRLECSTTTALRRKYDVNIKTARCHY